MKIKLLKHYTSRDTAIRPMKHMLKGKTLVEFYNINYTEISGEEALYMGRDYIRIQPLDEYEVIELNPKGNKRKFRSTFNTIKEN